MTDAASISEGTVCPRSVSVVIPAYDEAGGIASVVAGVLATGPALRALGLGGPEVIVVDDGSRDGTADAVPPGDSIVVIRHGRNRGYGAALKTGLARARGDLVAFLDADGTYPPAQLPTLCGVAVRGADVVIGSRMGASDTGMPFMRRFGNRLFAALVSALGDRPVRDCASGMRVIRRDALPLLYPLPDGLDFTPIMSLRAMHEGLRMVEVPIPYAERVGQSKLRVIADGLRYVASILSTALGYNPVRVLGFAGLAGVVLAGVVAVGLVTLRLSGVTTLGPWGVAATFGALVAGVGGVSLFTLGVLFNYLVTLFQRRPVRVGLFGRPLFRRPLEQHFGWAGTVTGLAGVAVAVTALTLGVRGWEVPRLWLYLVASALLILVGLQLVIGWVLVRTLDDLSQRDARSRADLAGGPERG